LRQSEREDEVVARWLGDRDGCLLRWRKRLRAGSDLNVRAPAAASAARPADVWRAALSDRDAHAVTGSTEAIVFQRSPQCGLTVHAQPPLACLLNEDAVKHLSVICCVGCVWRR
jgi:hypothetical protein